MLTYDEENAIMFPMALNAFYQNITIGSRSVKYSRLVSVGERSLEELLECIRSIPAEKEIVVDLESVDYAYRLFERFQSVERHLIFINIGSDSLYRKLKDSLKDLNFSEDRKRASWNMPYDSSFDRIAADSPSMVTNKIYADIVSKLIDKAENAQKLDSSGLYSNMYVNVKRLFLNPEWLYAVLYGLAKKIKESGIEYDGFISSSKNGALLAYLLGMMLGKKSVHIPGVGPRFAMGAGNVQKEIMKRKNYVYVFDFRCTGTEMKILSALVGSNDAFVKAALGIAVYRDEMSGSGNTRTICLVDLSKEGVAYKVAGEEADIIALRDKG